jgi:hypothetical protein
MREWELVTNKNQDGSPFSIHHSLSPSQLRPEQPQCHSSGDELLDIMRIKARLHIRHIPPNGSGTQTKLEGDLGSGQSLTKQN